MLTIPLKRTVIITARRLNGVVQADDATVIGFPADITYDFQSLEPDTILLRTSITPRDRIVSPAGEQVRIQAASGRSEATLEVLADEERLFVREGLVFGDCGDPLEPPP